MAKFKLISQPNYCGIKSSFYDQLFREHFDFEEYCADTTYDRNSCLFIASNIHPQDWLDQQAAQGYRVAVDNLHEVPEPSVHYRLINKSWFWYRESLMTQLLGYDRYRPQPSYTHLAFMPINQVRPWRDQLVQRLAPWLDQFVYSYRTQRLPGDCDPTHSNWQRYFNPDWYDQTHFSLVVESRLTNPEFITEKTWKPMAYWHPFMVYGPVGTLAFVKQLGFETFDNLWDESYDTMPQAEQRLDCIIKNLENFQQEPYSQLTLERLRHNHDRFYDRALVESRIRTEVIEPLLDYMEFTA